MPENALVSQKGNALLQVVVLLAVIIVGIYFISTRLITHKNVVMQTSSLLRVRFAIHSVMDYTYFAVQRRYCLDDNLLESPNCELKNTFKSIERILLSHEQAGYMQAMICESNKDLGLEFTCPSALSPCGTKPPIAANVQACKAQITTAKIRSVKGLDIVVAAKNISASHPLYSVIEPVARTLRAELIKDNTELHIRVKLERDEDPAIPRPGNEVFFKIWVTFEDQAGKVLVANRVKLQLTSFGTVYPREVGSFALMTARDMRLDGGPTLSGDVSIPVYHGTNIPSGPGLVFKSPVFVNQHIHLPKVEKGAGGNKSTNVKYAPVTFADRLVLGNGWVHEEGSLYKPESAGGVNDTSWSDNKLFGGFKMGVLIDNALDKGLLVFGGVIPSVSGDKTLMTKCIEREGIKTLTEKIIQAEFYANLIQSPPLNFNYEYRFGMTKGSSFAPQKAAAPPVEAASWDAPAPITRAPDLAPESILRVIVQLGPLRKVSAMLTADTLLTIPVKVGSQAYHDKLIADAAAAPAGPLKIEAQAKLAAFVAIKDDPGSIVIKTTPVVFPATAGAQTHLVDVKITFTKPEHFLDENGFLRAPRFDWIGFDSTYANGFLTNPSIYDGKPTATRDRLFRFLNFSRDVDGNLLHPDRFSLSDDGAPIPDEQAPYFNSSPKWDSEDYLAFDKLCEEARNAATGQSFGAAAWNIDFSPNTRDAWNFADPDGKPAVAGLDHQVASWTFHAGNSVMHSNNPDDPYNVEWNPPATDAEEWLPISRDEFRIVSIADECIIEPGARLVTGFFTCNNLIIKERTKKLTIVGTFIVKNLIFDGNAKRTFEAGIDWMSIYHPEATGILRASKVLRKVRKGGATPPSICDDGITAKPIWATTAATLQQIHDTLTCNVSWLRARAQPFQWTAMDPDCNIPPNAETVSNTSCKKHPVNFFVMEQGRGGGP